MSDKKIKLTSQQVISRSGKKCSNPTGKGGFKKGQSGNPGGRMKDNVHVRELARQYTEEAIKTLYQVMMNGRDNARVAAADVILDRGWGKAPQRYEDENGNAVAPVLQVQVNIRKPEDLAP